MSRITQRGATGALSLQANGSFQTSTDGNLATLVGTRWDLSDGREVMFVSVGATAITNGSLALGTSQLSATMTALNTAAIGSALVLTISSVTSAANFSYVVQFTRT